MNEEIRQDIFGRHVILSSSRSKRPGAFIDEKNREKACPFCPGHEGKTEAVIFSLPNEKQWKVRVFKNKYPVLHQRNFKKRHENTFNTYTPCGSHEVLIETNKHDREYFNMHEEDIVLIFRALKNRYETLMKIPDVNYVTIFKNKGVRAGASLSHPHMQIIAAPLFPREISREMGESESYYKSKKECAECEMVKAEIGSRKRMVMRNKDWAVYCPFVSNWPYQTKIVPRRHFSELPDVNSQEMLNLAKIIKKLFHAYSKLFDDPPYNIMYHNYPNSDFWHFHIQVHPRLVTHAGFEFFGLNVNITSPEKAATDLKSVL